MKTRMKSMLTLMVAVCLLLVFATPVMAAEETRGSYVEAARVTLYSAAGHSFVSFENLTNSSLTIGVYTVQGGESITIGTWSARYGRQFGGVWYNLESHLVSNGSHFGNTLASITVGFQLDELDALVERMTDFILTHDTHNSNYLCSKFALGLWNAALDGNLSITDPNSPTCLMERIQQMNGHQVGYGYVPILGSSKVGYKVNNTFYQVNMSAYTSTFANSEAQSCEIQSS